MIETARIQNISFSVYSVNVRNGTRYVSTMRANNSRFGKFIVSELTDRSNDPIANAACYSLLIINA